MKLIRLTALFLVSLALLLSLAACTDKEKEEESDASFSYVDSQEDLPSDSLADSDQDLH